MYPAEPTIGLDVRISLKYSEYQIFLQKCAEYQILSETPYLLNFLAHTKIYLSSWSKTDLGALLIVIHVTTNTLCLKNNFSTVLSIYADFSPLLTAPGCYGMRYELLLRMSTKYLFNAAEFRSELQGRSAISHINK